MATREQIRKHLAQSATIKFDNFATPTKGDEAKKDEDNGACEKEQRLSGRSER